MALEHRNTIPCGPAMLYSPLSAFFLVTSKLEQQRLVDK